MKANEILFSADLFDTHVIGENNTGTQSGNTPADDDNPVVVPPKKIV